MSTKRFYDIKDLEKKYGPMTVGLFLRSFRESERKNAVPTQQLDVFSVVSETSYIKLSSKYYGMYC
jgi:hypothetical protein